MEEFLRYVLAELVEHPEDLVISRAEQGTDVTFHVAARKIDLPRIIGKGGHTVQALRGLLQASAAKQGIRVRMEIVE